MQRLWRIVLVSAVVLVGATATVLGVLYSVGVFAEQGRFKAVPGCAVLDATTVAPVLPSAQLEASGENCTATDGATQINVGFTVVSKQGRVGGPELASRSLDAIAVTGGGTERLQGVGDQAIRQRTEAIGRPQIITMRVSNLIVVVSVANLNGGDLPAAVDDGLVQVARALAVRLAG
ncbi:hypothetical protein GCM10010399_29940 [Dactylosporangium fulvum]|uniref:Secreted protein n=1 Tax=Dactylosporangium fulvum TaxID=53359 RepID=A0ABY5W392_9ACTN|nr:hypothetical protein [Dactylosporangium fulvum]UWP83850.1 hypothetical protein Dfulv_06215 [Dactylosporangium fulvum]